MFAIPVVLFGLVAAADVPPDLARLQEQLLDRQEPRLQSQAALVLVQQVSPQAEEVVRQALRRTESAEVFLTLADALRLTRDRRFIDELLAALAAESVTVRQAAIDTLGALADARAVRRLQQLLTGPRTDPAVRLAAAAALGRSGTKAACATLIEQLTAEPDPARRAAALALEGLTGQQFGLDAERWRAWWLPRKDLSEEEWLAERLAYQGARSRRLEGDLERARNGLVRLHQQVHSRLPAGDRLGHVQSLVDQEDPGLRGLAVAWGAELLATADAVGQRAIADVLLRLSRDSSVEVQRAAVLALGQARDEAAYGRLRELLQRGAAPVRAAAVRGLAQQVRGTGPEAAARQRQVVPLLQKALDDPALEVVVEAAEDLGALGVPEAGPVLAALLRHPSEPVRQTAAQALERVAEPGILDGLLNALEDPVVTVRFSLVGAVGRAAAGGRGLPVGQRERLLACLESLLRRDTDPGVRSRAATVLGECAPPEMLTVLWARADQQGEDARVQEKAWAALVEILARSGSVELLNQWDRKLTADKRGARRIQLLTELSTRWQKREETRVAAAVAAEGLAQAHLDEGKWSAAAPVLRELLARPAGEAETERRLRLLLALAGQAARDGQRDEVQRAVREAEPFLKGRKELAAEFEKVAELP